MYDIKKTQQHNRKLQFQKSWHLKLIYIKFIYQFYVRIILITATAIMLVSCGQSKERELERKEKELALKERELNLKDSTSAENVKKTKDVNSLTNISADPNTAIQLDLFNENNLYKSMPNFGGYVHGRYTLNTISFKKKRQTNFCLRVRHSRIWKTKRHRGN
ncbi:MAG: hypothetical protein IPP81_19935 [Chitinophagaceae bacterium]|nr:hypothetical protein [Chitinophagaceae bacterium]